MFNIIYITFQARISIFGMVTPLFDASAIPIRDTMEKSFGDTQILAISPIHVPRSCPTLSATQDLGVAPKPYKKIIYN